MSFAYSEDFIEQVRFNNDIIDIISDYTRLEHSGKSYKGLCPFHDENTPSFFVNPEQQLYYCFGCGVGGDIFNFIMGVEGIDFRETVKLLADKAGLSLPEHKDNPQAKKKFDKRKKLMHIHELATRFYNYLLTSSDIGKKGNKYFNQRGFGNNIIQEFQLGFAPDRWEGLYRFLKNKGYSDQLLLESGLILPRKNNAGYYDRFRNRVIFTICNHQGQVIGFGGRIIEDINQPKYLNSPDTLIFDKSKNLYGLNLAKKFIQQSNEAIIVEGYTDVITAYQYGIKNVVASLGTSLTSEQAKLLKRYANTVYIAYDSDTAGAKATLRGLDILKEEGLEVKVIILPKDLDPDEFIKAEGKEGFARSQSQAETLIDFKISNILKGRSLENVDDKIKAVKGIIPVLAKVKNKVELDEYCKKISERLRTSEGVLRKEIDKYKFKMRGQDRKNKYRNNINNKSELADALNDPKLIKYLKAIKELLSIVFKNPNLINRLRAQLKIDALAKEEHKELFTKIFEFYQEHNALEINQILQTITNNNAKNLLLELSIRDNDFLDDTEKTISDYIETIKGYQREMRIERLNAEIKEAQKSGDFTRQMELMKEVQFLRKEGN
ncbi:DNA primase [Orenia metallireducens]|uniref:DNA primase n=1 Tax=Orenia metallireducens TaxID=1413210 RepID=A0A1C0A504_9FIRM|nr:DNA primase [Orenia metallireducens]OCL25199.1 DNA primase [Orenia metallireducens]